MKYGDLNLGQIEAIINKLGGMHGVKCFLSGELVVKAAELLRNVAGAIPVSAILKFVVADKFTKNNKIVRFAYFGDNFKRVMLGKVEENVSCAMLNVHTLVKASLDAPILTELGNRAETTLAYLHELLSKQPNGEDGVLLTNGYANIFYIRGTDDNFWAASAYWCGDGWGVYAYSVGYPRGWDAGSAVFSR